MNERNIIETQPERTDLPLIVIPVIVESMIEPFAANFPLLHDIARIRMHCDFTLDTDTILERTKDAEAVIVIGFHITDDILDAMTVLSSGFEIFFEKSPKRIAVRKVNQATSASCKAIASFAIRAFTSSSCVCFAFSAGIALTTKIVPPILSTKPVFISSTVITSLRKNRGVHFRTPRYQPKKDYSFS
jgi:hypothetical protein